MRVMNRILWSPDDGISGGFTPATGDEEDMGEVEVIFTPDGNPLPDPDAQSEPEKPDFEAILASKLAEIQAGQQTTQSSTNQDALIEALKALKSPSVPANAPQSDPTAEFKKFMQDQKDNLFKKPDEAIEKILEKYGQTIVGPALQQLNSENKRLQAMVNKQTISQSPMNKQIMEDYGTEVEKRAQELIMQGVAEPYNKAIQEVGFAHMNEITQKQVQSALAEATKPKTEVPVSGMQPGTTVATPAKRSIVLSEADKRRADAIGMDYRDYARSMGKV